MIGALGMVAVPGRMAVSTSRSGFVPSCRQNASSSRIAAAIVGMIGSTLAVFYGNNWWLIGVLMFPLIGGYAAISVDERWVDR